VVLEAHDVVVGDLAVPADLVEILPDEVDGEDLVPEPGVDPGGEADGAVGELLPADDLCGGRPAQEGLGGEQLPAELAVEALVHTVRLLEAVGEAAVLEVRLVRAESGLEGPEGLFGGPEAHGEPVGRFRGRYAAGQERHPHKP